MKLHFSRFVFAALFLVLLTAETARGQTSATEVWPKVSARLELRPKTRIEVFGGTQDGGDFQWNMGALLNYRIKRLTMHREKDIDEENEHLFVLGAGYEYLQTLENDKTKRENRIIIQGAAHHSPGAGLLVTDRNRVEFRWVNGAYNFRYRNKLIVDRAFRANKFRFTPYASGELFWDRNHHLWNENQYSFGVQLPYKQRLMLDIFYLHQNCTTCSQTHVNVAGLTLNLFFKRK